MGFLFDVLGSSSAGNAALLRTKEARFLVDAGFSGKKLRTLLAPFCLYLEDIDGVFITHEHSDHVAGLKVISALPGIRLFANRSTARALRGIDGAKWSFFETGKSFAVGSLYVETFPIAHDASDPVGFVFRSLDCHEGIESLAWMTDLGHTSTFLADRARDVQWLVLEANHDIRLLRDHPSRPEFLKRRILGKRGHHSNDDALQFLSSVEQAEWKKVFLAHLSRECNDVEQVGRLFVPLARKMNFDLEIVSP